MSTVSFTRAFRTYNYVRRVLSAVVQTALLCFNFFLNVKKLNETKFELFGFDFHNKVTLI